MTTTTQAAKVLDEKIHKAINSKCDEVDAILSQEGTPVIKLQAVKGLQAGEIVYTALLPLRMVDRFLELTEEDTPPEMRAQRTLNPARPKQISKYLLTHQTEYVLPSLTLLMRRRERSAFNETYLFRPADEEVFRNVGILTIPLDAKLLVADGQHRRAGIVAALKEESELGHDNIPVTIFPYRDLLHAQRMFHAINATPKKISGSLLDLYDHDDPWAAVARQVADAVPLFNGNIEKEKGSISGSTRRMYTLYHLKKACQVVWGNQPYNNPDTRKPEWETTTQTLIDGWTCLSAYILPWNTLLRRDANYKHFRENKVILHSVVLDALALLVRETLNDTPAIRKATLSKLSRVDWDKRCLHWKGRCVLEGKMFKSRATVLLTAAGLFEAVGKKVTLDMGRALETYEGELVKIPLRNMRPAKGGKEEGAA